MKIFFTLFITTLLLSANDYSLRLGVSQASKNDFGEILSAQTTPSTPKAYTVGLEAGYLLVENIKTLPLDFYVKGGINRYIEPEGIPNVKDFYEGTLYVKLYYGFFDKLLRIGIGEGVSYTFGAIPYVEQVEAQENNDNNSNYLNYLEVSYDIDIAKLFNSTLIDELYIGYTLKHRSGIYGLINNVSRGGSNYNMLTLEKNF